MIPHLGCCQEGKHKEDCSKCHHFWASFTLQQLINRHREVEHEEAEQVLCGNQPRLPEES